MNWWSACECFLFVWGGGGVTNLCFRQQRGPHHFTPTFVEHSAAALFAAAAGCCGLSRTLADICSLHAGFVGVLAHKALWNNEKALRLSELVCFTSLMSDYGLKTLDWFGVSVMRPKTATQARFFEETCWSLDALTWVLQRNLDLTKPFRWNVFHYSSGWFNRAC